jgi:hypothetical protein
MRIDISIVPASNIDRAANQYTTGGMKIVKTIYADDDSIVVKVDLPPEDAAIELTPELKAQYLVDSRALFKEQIDALFDMFEYDSSANIAMGGALGASLTKTLYDYTIIRGTTYND